MPATSTGGRVSEMMTSFGGEELKKLTSRISVLTRQGQVWYSKREPREKVLVQIGGALLGIFLLYNLVYIPAISLREGAQSQITNAEREIGDVQRMTDRYVELKAELAAVERRTVPPGKDFSLFSVLESTLTSTVGREKIGSITPADKKISNELMEYTVDLKLNDVTLPQLVDALYGIKGLSVPVNISNLNIKKKFQNPHSFDVQMTCFALGKNG